MPTVSPEPANGPVVGAERTTVTKDCLRRYRQGDSIRTIAKDIGRSYGFAHRILTEGGAHFRARGGPRTRRTP